MSISAIQVGKVWKTQRELIVTGNIHIRVLGGASPRTIPKDTLAEITAVSPAVIEVNCKAGGGVGIHAWGLKLQVQRALWGQYFAPDTGGPPTPALPPPNLSQIFQRLSQRQKAVREGMMAMQAARIELKKDIASGQMWGTLAVLANAAMLPLNIVINAFDAKAAVSIYQRVVKELYAKLSKSGTRIDNKLAKEGLGLIKKAVVEELTRKGLTRYVPGVNIIVGMAEDSVAFMETATMVGAGDREMRRLLDQVDAKIAAAQREFGAIGVEMERLLAKMDTIRRTA